ncbi:class I SAM-dependent methyltransferase [Corynebacterium nasicanis]
MEHYWNHNTAYHPWILSIVAERPRSRVLDVGCGDGLLLARLAPLAGTIVGLEPDPATARAAAARLAHLPHARVEKQTLEEHTPSAPYDIIIFVASLHHMDLGAALSRARELLIPGGELLVVGLSANRSVFDWLVSAVQVLPVRLGSWLHREARDIGVPVAAARESIAEIRATARTILPGARLRRGLYYRYLLRWRKPTTAAR